MGLLYYEEMIESEFNKAGGEKHKDTEAMEQPKSAERIGGFLQWAYEHPFTDIAAALELEKHHLLTPLEETGILPKSEEPNPYDPDESPDEYEQWWEAHPDEQQAFLANVTRREQALRDMWLGVVLYRMTGGKLFEGFDLARSSPNRINP